MTRDGLACVLADQPYIGNHNASDLVLSPGDLAVVIAKHGVWRKVLLPSGKSGWITVSLLVSVDETRQEKKSGT